jgi:hypothetical protein
MLAIVETMDKWRHYFEGSGHKTTVISDHKNLLWFTETKVYNCRQARWVEKMSHFDFVITFRPGKLSGKPDALSQRPDHMHGEHSIPTQATTFLRPDQIDLSQANILNLTLNTAVAQTMNIDDEFAQLIKASLPADRNVGPYLHLLREPTQPCEDDVKLFLEPFVLHETGLLLRNGLIYIPENDDLKLQILHSRHDSPIAGHLGRDKTYELVTRDYYWPCMRSFIKEYINTCDTCARNKTLRQKPHGTLHSLPIPPAP